MKRILSFCLVSLFSINAIAQAPANYYDGTAGLTGYALKTKLHQIIKVSSDLGYSALWVTYATSDVDHYYENNGTLLDMYSEKPAGPDTYEYIIGSPASGGNQCGSQNQNNEGFCYNREHSLPKTYFGGQNATPMANDAHFVIPTDYYVNSKRGSYPYGETSSPTISFTNGSKIGPCSYPGYSGVVFEPIDEFKGDIARMQLYFVTRYEDKLASFSQFQNASSPLDGTVNRGLQQWYLNLMLEWASQDPVSQREIDRNNAVYARQGNRNPYIDHPEYVNMVWANSGSDTEAPSIPANLTANNPTDSTISLNWTASTDNVGVAGYDVYANGVLKATVSGTSTTVTGLTPLTTYNFYVIAKDTSGNSSAQSNIATGTTLAAPVGGSCGNEDFENIPTASGTGYTTQTWTHNNITWTATDARTDQSITNKAITVRNGSLTSSTISGGIKSLTLTTQLKFGGSPGYFNVLINNVNVGTIPYSATATATTIDNINVSGNIIIQLTNSSTSNRVALDDLSWECFSTLATTETKKDKADFTIYPNPVKHNELFVKGENLNKISKAEIYDLSGKLIDTVSHPFKDSNKINLKGLVKGNYILKADNYSAKFIIE